MTRKLRVLEICREAVAWRHDLHRHPELRYDLPRTSRKVADLLKSFGLDEVIEGIAESGVVGILNGKRPGKGIGLRAEMDALPIVERSGLPYASTIEGRMHACGHDGHCAMLLGAAQYLAETRDFSGRAIFIFQPAEEVGAGARAMVQAGLMDRFAVDEVYAIHNMPDEDASSFSLRQGGIMAASDWFEIEIEGSSGHAAWPHQTIDPVMISAQVITALHTIVSRRVDPLQPAVLSVTMMQGGEAFNVIPKAVKLTGTARTLDQGVQEKLEQCLKSTAIGVAQALGGQARVTYGRGYPITFNAPKQTEHAAAAASRVPMAGAINMNVPPKMGGEDFSFMLQERPGALIFLGNGNGPPLHSDTYDFNDEIIEAGINYFVELVQ